MTTPKAETPKPIRMREDEYEELCECYGGVCLACGELVWDGVEPDAEGYECESCGEPQVMGAEQALLEERIELHGEGEIESEG